LNGILTVKDFKDLHLTDWSHLFGYCFVWHGQKIQLMEFNKKDPHSERYSETLTIYYC